MSRTGPNEEAGFTLLEVLVVITILSLAVTIVGIALPGAQERTALTRTESGIVSLLVEAQAEARRSAVARRVTFDLDAHRVHLEGTRLAFGVSKDVRITIVSAQEVGTARRPALVFLPDGSSSGAEIAIASGPYGSRLRVDWVTGRTRRD
ncbi:prepilin-type N-terminal cleavage/methylation domain-containing protein [Microvirga sp. 2YAF29]|uniref:prepilin-type N-terminal cleavage/methylation domain-containing protein n=1 Tax=Microvirga sp. 2YAF29 TaxID=3233031 RepID=UPI003F9EA43B